MNEDVAWYILRCEIALAEEGIGAEDWTLADRAITDQAFKLAGHRVPSYHRWVFRDETERQGS
jgi:hypothetical protein